MPKHILLACATLVFPFSASADEEAKTPSAEAKITLTEGTWKDVTRLVEKSHGKVVVVDLWSTSCLPCIKEYPNLVELQKRHRDDVVCISLNLDYAGIRSKPPAFYRPRVEKFLKEKKSALHNFLCTVEAIETMDELKIFSIPAVFVFNQEGKLAKRFDESLLQEGEEEAFTYKDDINPFVEKLLK